MSNTLKATKLDFSLVKPYIKVIGFTMLLPFAAINRSILTGVSFAMCFIAMTTGYTFSVTEKNSMERLYGILPIKKSEMVTGRYLFVLALGAMALVVSLITQPIVLRAMGESVGAFDMISAAIGGLFLFALYMEPSKAVCSCIFLWLDFWRPCFSCPRCPQTIPL